MAKTARHTELPSRAALLARKDFFLRRFIFDKIVFAEMPAGEGVAYGVAMRLENQNLYCTCAYYPKPCNHALAFRTLFDAAGEGIFTPADECPAWLEALLAGLPAIAFTSKNPEKAAVDKQQRRFERLDRATNGFEDLEAWLLDTARRGLATVVSEDPQWWEGIAARMADASMPGLSRSLRLVGRIPASEPDWAEQTTGVLADCYLAVRAFRNRDNLPVALLHDLQNFIGINTRKDEVLATGEQLSDIWAVVGQIEEPLEDKLAVRRSWLFGGKSGRYALLLDYAFGGAGFPPGLEPGGIRQGKLAFYASAFPLRALVVEEFVSIPKKVEKLPGFEDFETFARAYSAALAAQPWLQTFPAAFGEVTPQVQGGSFFIVDRSNKMLRLDVPENAGWRLVALGGGAPIGLFGEWNGAVFRPLGVVAEGRFVSVQHQTGK